MVYTPALVLGPGIPVLPREDGVVKLMRKLVREKTRGDGDAHRGGLETTEGLVMERDSSSLCSETSSEYEEILQRYTTREIERCLSAAKGSSLCCQALLLPRQLTDKVARDVVRSSADEPCGLRGASIRVYLERNEVVLSLGSIFPDPSVTPTFEMSVIFKANKGWPPLKHIFVTDKVLKLRPEYRLIKKKLYSSASPVIRDFYWE